MNSFFLHSDLSNLDALQDAFPEVYEWIREFQSDQQEFTLHTSGSTGTPKEVAVSRRALEFSATNTLDFFKLKAGDTALLCLPVKFIGGKMMVVRALLRRLNMLIVSATSNPMEHLCGDEAIHFAAMTPMQVSKVISSDNAKLLNGIAHLILGGAPVSGGLEKQLQSFDVHCYETYGMTETVSHVALRKLNAEKEFHAVSMDIQFTTNPQNCLQIHAPYYSEDVILTNDVVELISPTSFRWLGRFDFVVNSGGIKVHPEEIERFLSPVIPHAFIVTGIPDEVLGEKLILIIETDQLSSDSTIRINKRLTEIPNPYHCPKAIRTLSQFARTENGKIQRHATRNLLRQ